MVALDHPDALRLIDAVQMEYVRRYGGPDGTPVDPTEFVPPRGAFFVAYVGGEPAAMGGWRRSDVRVDGGSSAEVKRMFVVERHRRAGRAKALLQRLESTAAEAGATHLILETGTAQPEAIALYRAAGFVDVPRFGHYSRSPDAIHLGKALTGPPRGDDRPGAVDRG